MNAIKPMPKFDEKTHNAKQCLKCGGTGFWCKGIENGRPISNTGFQCFTCNGTGWKVSWKRGAKKAYWDSVEPIRVIRDESGNVLDVVQ